MVLDSMIITGNALDRTAIITSFLEIKPFSWRDLNIALAAEGDPNAVTNVTPRDSCRWPNLISGLAIQDIL
jgi:hypothetical protein